MDFMISLYREQIEAGRYFLHEHPRHATSWRLRKMEDLMAIEGVELVEGDQCQFGSEIRRGQRKGDPVKKPIGCLSNAPELLKELARRCTGVGGSRSRPEGGRHALCSGTHAKGAAVYPRGLCRAILQGTVR